MAADVLLTQGVGAAPIEKDFWERRRAAVQWRMQASNAAGGGKGAGAPVSGSLLTSLAPASPLSADLVTRAVPDPAHLPQPLTDEAARLASLAAPYGTVREAFFSPSPEAPLVVQIQDAHDVLDAQKNISRIIQEMEKGSGAPGLLVGVEGAAGGFDMKPFRDFPDGRSVGRVADYFLALNLMGGAEHAGWTAGREPTLWGVEDPDLYLANVDAFMKASPLQDALRGRLKGLQGRVDLLKSGRYPAALLALDRAKADFLAGKKGLGDYARSLRCPAAASLPNFSLFLKALDMEGAMDFPRVERERLVLTERLTARLPGPRLETLVQAALQYRLGRVTGAAFYGRFEALCGEGGVSLKDFPEMRRYLDYVVAVERIRREELLAELARAEALRLAPFLAAPEIAALHRLSEDLLLAGKLADFAMSPEDWAAYQSARERTARLPGRLESLEGKSSAGVTDDFPAALRPFEAFCDAALRRDGVLMENLLEKMSADGRRTAALVAGGFHTDGMKALLRRKGVSYVVVTPRIDVLPEEGNYLDVFLRGKSALEEAFSAERVTLKSFVNGWTLYRWPGHEGDEKCRIAASLLARLTAIDGDLPPEVRAALTRIPGVNAVRTRPWGPGGLEVEVNGLPPAVFGEEGAVKGSERYKAWRKDWDASAPGGKGLAEGVFPAAGEFYFVDSRPKTASSARRLWPALLAAAGLALAAIGCGPAGAGKAAEAPVAGALPPETFRNLVAHDEDVHKELAGSLAKVHWPSPETLLGESPEAFARTTNMPADVALIHRILKLLSESSPELYGVILDKPCRIVVRPAIDAPASLPPGMSPRSSLLLEDKDKSIIVLLRGLAPKEALLQVVHQARHLADGRQGKYTADGDYAQGERSAIEAEAEVMDAPAARPWGFTVEEALYRHFHAFAIGEKIWQSPSFPGKVRPRETESEVRERLYGPLIGAIKHFKEKEGYAVEDLRWDSVHLEPPNDPKAVAVRFGFRILRLNKVIHVTMSFTGQVQSIEVSLQPSPAREMAILRLEEPKGGETPGSGPAPIPGTPPRMVDPSRPASPAPSPSESPAKERKAPSQGRKRVLSGLLNVPGAKLLLAVAGLAAVLARSRPAGAQEAHPSIGISLSSPDEWFGNHRLKVPPPDRQTWPTRAIELGVGLLGLGVWGTMNRNHPDMFPVLTLEFLLPPLIAAGVSASGLNDKSPLDAAFQAAMVPAITRTAGEIALIGMLPDKDDWQVVLLSLVAKGGNCIGAGLYGDVLSPDRRPFSLLTCGIGFVTAQLDTTTGQFSLTLRPEPLGAIIGNGIAGNRFMLKESAQAGLTPLFMGGSTEYGLTMWGNVGLVPAAFESLDQVSRRLVLLRAGEKAFRGEFLSYSIGPLLDNALPIPSPVKALRLSWGQDAVNAVTSPIPFLDYSNTVYMRKLEKLSAPNDPPQGAPFDPRQNRRAWRAARWARAAGPVLVAATLGMAFVEGRPALAVAWACLSAAALAASIAGFRGARPLGRVTGLVEELLSMDIPPGGRSDDGLVKAYQARTGAELVVAGALAHGWLAETKGGRGGATVALDRRLVLDPDSLPLSMADRRKLGRLQKALLPWIADHERRRVRYARSGLPRLRPLQDLWVYVSRALAGGVKGAALPPSSPGRAGTAAAAFLTLFLAPLAAFAQEIDRPYMFTIDVAPFLEKGLPLPRAGMSDQGGSKSPSVWEWLPGAAALAVGTGIFAYHLNDYRDNPAVTKILWFQAILGLGQGVLSTGPDGRFAPWYERLTNTGQAVLGRSGAVTGLILLDKYIDRSDFMGLPANVMQQVGYGASNAAQQGYRLWEKFYFDVPVLPVRLRYKKGETFLPWFPLQPSLALLRTALEINDVASNDSQVYWKGLTKFGAMTVWKNLKTTAIQDISGISNEGFAMAGLIHLNWGLRDGDPGSYYATAAHEAAHTTQIHEFGFLIQPLESLFYDNFPVTKWIDVGELVQTVGLHYGPSVFLSHSQRPLELQPIEWGNSVRRRLSVPLDPNPSMPLDAGRNRLALMTAGLGVVLALTGLGLALFGGHHASWVGRSVLSLVGLVFLRGAWIFGRTDSLLRWLLNPKKVKMPPAGAAPDEALLDGIRRTIEQENPGTRVELVVDGSRRHLAAGQVEGTVGGRTVYLDPRLVMAGLAGEDRARQEALAAVTARHAAQRVRYHRNRLLRASPRLQNFWIYFAKLWRSFPVQGRAPARRAARLSSALSRRVSPAAVTAVLAVHSIGAASPAKIVDASASSAAPDMPPSSPQAPVSVAWERPAPGAVEGSQTVLLLNGRSMVLVAENAGVVARDAQGATLWTAPGAFGGRSLTAASYSNGTKGVVAFSEPGAGALLIHCLDAATGQELLSPLHSIITQPGDAAGPVMLENISNGDEPEVIVGLWQNGATLRDIARLSLEGQPALVKTLTPLANPPPVSQATLGLAAGKMSLVDQGLQVAFISKGVIGVANGSDLRDLNGFPLLAGTGGQGAVVSAPAAFSGGIAFFEKMDMGGGAVDLGFAAIDVQTWGVDRAVLLSLPAGQTVSPAAHPSLGKDVFGDSAAFVLPALVNQNGDIRLDLYTATSFNRVPAAYARTVRSGLDAGNTVAYPALLLSPSMVILSTDKRVFGVDARPGAGTVLFEHDVNQDKILSAPVAAKEQAGDIQLDIIVSPGGTGAPVLRRLTAAVPRGPGDWTGPAGDSRRTAFFPGTLFSGQHTDVDAGADASGDVPDAGIDTVADGTNVPPDTRDGGRDVFDGGTGGKDAPDGGSTGTPDGGTGGEDAAPDGTVGDPDAGTGGEDAADGGPIDMPDAGVGGGDGGTDGRPADGPAVGPDGRPLDAPGKEGGDALTEAGSEEDGSTEAGRNTPPWVYGPACGCILPGRMDPHSPGYGLPLLFLLTAPLIARRAGKPLDKRRPFALENLLARAVRGTGPAGRRQALSRLVEMSVIVPAAALAWAMESAEIVEEILTMPFSGKRRTLLTSFLFGKTLVDVMAVLRDRGDGTPDPVLARWLEALYPSLEPRAEAAAGRAARLERLWADFTDSPLDVDAFTRGVRAGFQARFRRKLSEPEARWLALQALSGRRASSLPEALERSMMGANPATVALEDDSLSDRELESYAEAVLASHAPADGVRKGMALFVASAAMKPRLEGVLGRLKAKFDAEYHILEVPADVLPGRRPGAARLSRLLNDWLESRGRKAGEMSSWSVVSSGIMDFTGVENLPSDDPIRRAIFIALKDLLAVPLGRPSEARALEGFARLLTQA